MNTQTKRLTLCAVVLLAAFAAACMETEKANKLIDVGNAAFTEGNKLLEEASAKNNKVVDLLSAAASKSHDEEEEPGPAANTQAIKTTAQAAIDDFDKSAAKFREAAAKFDEASKLKVPDKMKEYWTLKSQAFTKLAERADVMKGNCKAVMVTDDNAALAKTFGENKERIDKLYKDATDLSEKANKIQQDNKDIFKKE